VFPVSGLAVDVGFFAAPLHESLGKVFAVFGREGFDLCAVVDLLRVAFGRFVQLAGLFRLGDAGHDAFAVGCVVSGVHFVGDHVLGVLHVRDVHFVVLHVKKKYAWFLVKSQSLILIFFGIHSEQLALVRGCPLLLGFYVLAG